MSTFNIDRPLLSNILTEIGTGRIQLQQGAYTLNDKGKPTTR